MPNVEASRAYGRSNLSPAAAEKFVGIGSGDWLGLLIIYS